ncbi:MULTISPECIES: DMT family transporter [Rhizobium/Agrobacterium group]|uniref:DMT family transporter n=1 Tax=Rhizobium/Agrobacterium group TaxID=227290 RepID=UPI0008DC113E|nr:MULTISPECIES: DMT family transporter [Rhizobium/Agrobacterium group]MCF1435341.1 DMT family transporter [Allorhizobium ampelinum]MUO89818.1 EamA family transporter [Agrobacterium vitis]MUZ53245.1 EamA family transporter [Agrobacterium vitis]MUZ91464.1 EamA family transporter [Agrobacterium vitis]MVA40092.1 EamA family transporter [Agrobacterium vitis]
MVLTRNMKGALFMAAAMAGFTINDALSKSLTEVMSVGQIMLVRGALTTLLVYGIARQARAVMSPKLLGNPLIMTRVLCEILASITYLTALSAIPLANAASILQSLPLAVTLGAAVFLREPVGWRRWLAIIAGFIGVMIIIRPGPAGFTLSALYVLGSVFFAATRDLVTTRIDRATPSIVITLMTAAGNALAGAALIPFQGGWQPLSLPSFGVLVCAAILMFIGYQCIILAMRTADISFIAPFRYSGLLWAIGLGILVFHEWPDPWMLLGMAVVVGSGLYTFHRERLRKIRDASALAV